MKSFIWHLLILLVLWAYLSNAQSLLLKLSPDGDPLASLIIPKGLSRSVSAFYDSRDVTNLCLWISSNESFVLASFGTIAAIQEGTADVAVQYLNVTNTTLSVLCTAPIPIEVLVVPATPSPLPQNETIQFRAQTRLSDGKIQSGGAGFLWGSSRPDLASIDSTGLAIALASSGRTLITATTFDGLSSEPVVLIVVPVSLVKITITVLNASSPQLDGPGHTLELQAIGEFTDGSSRVLDPQELQWISSDTTAAIVDESGVVIGISSSTSVQIRVSSKNNVFAQIFVSVGNRPLRSPLDDACAAYRSCDVCLTDLRCTWCVSGSIVSCSSAGDIVCSEGLLIVGLESCKADNPRNNENSLRTMDLVGIAVACVIGLFFFGAFLGWVIYLLIRGPTVEVSSQTMVEQHAEDM